MSIDLSGVVGVSDDYGVVTQIADASGRVLWSATIKFTINGDTYIADRGMTWAEWFASDYNTTGETEGTITDANGNEVSMDAVIVGGTAYEVGFAEMVAVSFGSTMLPKAVASVNGALINFETNVNLSYEVPVGATIAFTNTSKASGLVSIVHADGTRTNTNINSNGGSYLYTVICKTSVVVKSQQVQYGPSMYENYTPYITITEIPENYVNVRVTTFKNDSSSSSDAKAVFTFPEQIPNPDGSGNVTTLTLNASSGNKAFFAPSGTTVACTVKQEKGNARITLNGTTVKKGSGTYNYTVTKDVHIDLTSHHEESNDYGRITITET